MKEILIRIFVVKNTNPALAGSGFFLPDTVSRPHVPNYFIFDIVEQSHSGWFIVISNRQDLSGKVFLNIDDRIFHIGSSVIGYSQ